MIIKQTCHPTNMYYCNCISLLLSSRVHTLKNGKFCEGLRVKMSIKCSVLSAYLLWFSITSPGSVNSNASPGGTAFKSVQNMKEMSNFHHRHTMFKAASRITRLCVIVIVCATITSTPTFHHCQWL